MTGDAGGSVEIAVKQCAVLFVNPESRPSPYPAFLRALGFLVRETRDWPQLIGDVHVVVIRILAIDEAPMIAARIRAKPHFGRRLLIALACDGASPEEQRATEAAGFDRVLADGCDGRVLTAWILRGIRRRPELRCVLPPSLTRRPAA